MIDLKKATRFGLHVLAIGILKRHKARDIAAEIGIDERTMRSMITGNSRISIANFVSFVNKYEVTRRGFDKLVEEMTEQNKAISDRMAKNNGNRKDKRFPTSREVLMSQIEVEKKP